MTAITAVTVQNTMGVASYEELAADGRRSDPRRRDRHRGRRRQDGHARLRRDRRGGREAVSRPASRISSSIHGRVEARGFAARRRCGRRPSAHDLPCRDARDAEPARGREPRGDRVETTDDMLRAADAIRALGPRAVLVKAGRLEVADREGPVRRRRGCEWIESERIDTAHTHGTGCTSPRRSRRPSRGRRPARGGARRQGVRDAGDPSLASARGRRRARRPALEPRPGWRSRSVDVSGREPSGPDRARVRDQVRDAGGGAVLARRVEGLAAPRVVRLTGGRTTRYVSCASRKTGSG